MRAAVPQLLLLLAFSASCLPGSRAEDILGGEERPTARKLLQSDWPLSLPANFSTYWMTDLWQALSKRPVNQIFMAGTHDSGTWNLRNNVVSLGKGFSNGCSSTLAASTIRPWAVSQTLSIVDQIRAGARYIDARVAWEPKSQDYYFIHCLLSQTSVGSQFKDISNLLATDMGPSVTRPNGQKPQEVIFINFYDFYGNWTLDRHSAFMQYVINSFQPGQIYMPGSSVPTLAQATGGQSKVVLIYWNKNGPTTNWAGLGPIAKYFVPEESFMQRKWVDQATNRNLVQADTQVYQEYMNTTGYVFKVIEGVLTPNAGSMAAGNLQKLERNTQDVMVSWAYEDVYGQCGRSCKPFVLMLDWLQPIYSTMMALMNINRNKYPVYVPGYYGECSSVKQGTQCATSWEKCAPGYPRILTGLRGGSCKCQCCVGSDCGCSTQSGAWCP